VIYNEVGCKKFKNQNNGKKYYRKIDSNKKDGVVN